MISSSMLAVLAASLVQLAVPAEARSLWSSSPAVYGSFRSTRTNDYILKSGYPVGNGKLGAISFGPPGAEKLALNVDSLWSGGPFENSSYRGGNPDEAVYDALPAIRSVIFANGTGDMDALLGPEDYYGSYRTLGNLSITVSHGSHFKNYKRSLNLETGIYETSYEVNGVAFQTAFFCSYPSEVCVYRISSSKDLPQITTKFENVLTDPTLFNLTCANGYTRIRGVTQLGPPQGMVYDAIARLYTGSGHGDCSSDGGLSLAPTNGRKALTIVIGAGTNFEQTHGNAQHEYSFKGEDPAKYVESVTTAAAQKCFSNLQRKHNTDFSSLFGSFTLTLPDTKNSAAEETSKIISGYDANGSGDPFLEGLLFDYSRYLLVSSSRDNSLPANLQGRWTEKLTPNWSSDYHANINLQMNYWVADQTGLSRTQPALWNYMTHNWAPRGVETAKLLYNASGWVVHNEMNIFGHSAMKDDPSWANYPASAAWMMQHVWDNFDYTQDVAWLKEQGYPLIKGVAEFWLSQLQLDDFFKDGSLVVNPCNSPEHGPTTFGCANYQQLIHQVFEAVLTAAPIVSENDEEFSNGIAAGLTKLDKGLHFTNWGGIKEWKLPDSYGFDDKNTHRHLSHLVGWYPGYSISSFADGYKNASIQTAITETLRARGAGKGEDADSGWEKVWRSACWARLNNTEQAHFEMRFAIKENFAGNGFSMYNGLHAPFQIDANFGIGGAVLSMLVADLPSTHETSSDARIVVLGPAIPASWGGGGVQGLRLRGGKSVNFSWDKTGKVTQATLQGAGKAVTLVDVEGKKL